MQQVPQYLVIGSGRMARHCRHYFDLLGLSFFTWARKENTLEQLPSYAKLSSHVLLLVTDSAIAPFIQQHGFLKNKVLVHFSGQLSLSDANSAHPLMTFGEHLYDCDTYQKIPFILETGRAEMKDILPGLPNPSFTIPPPSKPYYHALCVMSGNFTTVLWKKFFEEMEKKFAIPKSATIPYLTKIMDNLIENPDTALSGPFARKDQTTVRANVEALEHDPFQSIYKAFAKMFGLEKETV